MTKTCLLVLHHSVFSGPQNTALRISGKLRELGWNTVVLMATGPGTGQDRLESGGVEVLRMPLHRARAQLSPRHIAGYVTSFVPEVRQLKQVMDSRKVDAVIIGGLANPHAAIAGRLAGVPVIWQILDTRLPAPLRRIMMTVVRRYADVVMFTGRALIDVHRAGNLKKPSFVYYPPVDTRRFTPSPKAREEMRRSLGLPEGALLVGTVANLNPQKGVEYFVRAAEILCRDFANVWFIVVGATYPNHMAYADRVYREAAARIPRGRIIFETERRDVEKVYQALDVKVISSVPRSEGVPTTALEALACGVPVVATNVGASHEVVEEGVTGNLVAPLDTRALAEAIGGLLRAPSVRAKMALAARKQAEERYDVASCARVHLLALQASSRARSSRRPSRSGLIEHGGQG